MTISITFHTLLVLGIIYFAAREGFLGKKIQSITVQVVKEKKPPEKPKEQPKPKPEPPKIVEKKPEAPKAETPKAAPPPVSQPVVAPANTELPAFQFAGGKAVDTESDPNTLYKGYMEYILRQSWNRPQNLDDAKFVDEVQVHVDKNGDISQPVWLKDSGNAKWDDSVKQVFQVVTNIGRVPPTNFPPQVTIRFDTVEQTEPVFQ